MALVRRADPTLARGRDAPILDEADVEAGAAGVTDDEVGLESFGVCVGERRDRCHRGPGVDRVDRAPDDVIESQAAARRRHNEQLTGEAGGAEVVGDLSQVPLHERLQRRVERGGRCPPVLADDGVQLVRERVGDAREPLADELAERLLVLRVRNRPDEADGDRLDIQLAGLAHERPRALPIEGAVDPSLRIDPPRHLEGQAPWDVGLGIALVEVEGVRLTAFAEGEDVGEACRREERGAGGLALQDRVRRAGRAVDEERGAREELVGSEREVGGDERERVPRRVEHAVGRRQRLCEGKTPVLVGDDDIGERPTRVDGDAVTRHEQLSITRSRSRARRGMASIRLCVDGCVGRVTRRLSARPSFRRLLRHARGTLGPWPQTIRVD